MGSEDHVWGSLPLMSNTSAEWEPLHLWLCVTCVARRGHTAEQRSGRRRISLKAERPEEIDALVAAEVYDLLSPFPI